MVISVLRASRAERNLDRLEILEDVEVAVEADSGTLRMELDDVEMEAELDGDAMAEDDTVGEATPFRRVPIGRSVEGIMTVSSSISTISLGQSL